jgi:hypothetical protein
MVNLPVFNYDICVKIQKKANSIRLGIGFFDIFSHKRVRFFDCEYNVRNLHSEVMNSCFQ